MRGGEGALLHEAENSREGMDGVERDASPQRIWKLLGQFIATGSAPKGDVCRGTLSAQENVLGGKGP